MVDVTIRAETIDDYNSVHQILLAAFDGTGEATLVDKLRDKGVDDISLVAQNGGGHLVGHIMFSPVTLENHTDARILGLAPVAVMPDEQGKGHGGALIKAGIEEAQKMGVQAIVLLGHAGYYPRFGFKPSIDYDISCEYDVPAENFMVLELVDGALSNVSGCIQYHPVFAEL